MDRINRILRLPEYLLLMQEIGEAEQQRRFCRHSLQHALDTARIAYILTLEEKASPAAGTVYTRELVYAAALLHDIGRAQAYLTGEDHALLSARKAVPLLRAAGFGENEQVLVCRAIEEHRGKTAGPSYLGHCLHRADLLSRPCAMCGVRSECHRYPAGGDGGEPSLFY